MKTKLFLSAIVFFMVLTAQAQEVNEHYIEVTGTSEIEIMPDKIHYIIEIREYFEEEFDGKSKPEEYHTKVPLSQIEQGLRKKLSEVGITQDVIRTLTDFKQIDEIIKHIDTKGINTMRIGELENKDMLVYHQKGKIEALKAAQRKATYLVEALGKRLGNVIRIVEKDSGNAFPIAQSNVLSSNVASFDNFRTIKKDYSMLVRFEIVD